MARAESGATIAVSVVYCPGPGAVDEVDLRLAATATLRDALAASGLAERHPGIDLRRAGVWGHVRRPEHVLRDGDRVEVYRALQVDPKEARRLRYRGQRARPKAAR
jgi:putative ubiquitin-RnfH superfamily antitoxin RatB of RatAB toxin-antitoxin module